MIGILFFVALLFLSLAAGGSGGTAATTSLVNTHIRCASDSECTQALRDEWCKYKYTTCQASYCRVLYMPVCNNTRAAAVQPRRCNDLDGHCVVRQCAQTTDCDRRHYCDGVERCLAGHCVFDAQADYCAAQGKLCMGRRCVPVPTTAPTTGAPTGVPTTTGAPTTRAPRTNNFHAADNVTNTTAPTAAPTTSPLPVNLWLYGTVLISVMLFVFLVAVLVATLSRVTQPYIVPSKGTQITYIY